MDWLEISSGGELDVNYLKSRYHMFPVYGGDLSRINGPNVEDYRDCLLVEVYCRSTTGHGSHDMGTRGFIWLASNNEDLVRKVRGFQSESSRDKFFKPIFRDLAINANFRDPYQCLYDEKALQKVESVLSSLASIDQTSLKSKLPFKTGTYGRYSGLDQTYVLKTIDGIQAVVTVAFQPKLPGGCLLNVEIKPDDFGFYGWFEERGLENPESVSASIDRGIAAYWRELADISKSVRRVLEEFPFLIKLDGREYSRLVGLKNGFSFEAPSNDHQPIVVNEIYVQILYHPSFVGFHDGMSSAQVFTNLNGAFSAGRKFDSYAHLSAWLSNRKNIQPFLDFNAKIESALDELEAGRQRKIRLLKNYEIPNLGITLKHEPNYFEGYSEPEALCVCQGGVLLAALCWDSKWDLMSESDFKYEVLNIVKSELAHQASNKT